MKMRFKLTCRYCGTCWKIDRSSSFSIEYERCKYCNDSNLEINKDDTIDTYKGAPAFEDKEEPVEDELDPMDLYNGYAD